MHYREVTKLSVKPYLIKSSSDGYKQHLNAILIEEMLISFHMY